MTGPWKRKRTARPWMIAAMRVASGLLAMWAMAVAPAARACNVPVFRFALERWVSDNYVLVVAHDAPLAPAQKEIVEKLSATSTDNDGFANLTVQVVDLKASPDDPAIEHLPLADVALPAAFLFYPAGFGTPTLVWKAPLTEENLRRLNSSPVREDFLGRVTKGSTAVWLLLESGDRAADDRAEQVLRENLASAEQELELPSGVIHPSGEVTGGEVDNGYFDPENQLESGIPLKIDFEVIRMPADGEKEEVFLGMLLHSEPGLLEKRGQPMAFPLFGRGRILQPLVGDQIQTDNILAISEYLCGPCSCQVKAQNPGVDMLLEVDWETKLAGVSAIPERELPPLSGTAAITGEAPATDPPSAPAAVEFPPAAAAAPASRVVGRSVIWVGAGVLVLLAGATMVIIRKNR